MRLWNASLQVLKQDGWVVVEKDQNRAFPPESRLTRGMGTDFVGRRAREPSAAWWTNRTHRAGE